LHHSVTFYKQQRDDARAALREFWYDIRETPDVSESPACQKVEAKLKEWKIE
jgi:hypothetical protein